MNPDLPHPESDALVLPSPPPTLTALQGPLLPPDVLLRLEELFGDTGLLSTKYAFKRRKSQAQMHQIIYEALSLNQGAMIEAATGTGKTFGYLFPACEYILHRRAKGFEPKVVISTASKSLQDQLLHKDFGILKEVYPSIKCTVWKGAANYLCLNRLTSLIAKGRSKLIHEAKLLLEHKADLEKLEFGTRDDLPVKVSDDLWNEICGATPCCSPKDPEKCFKRKAFNEAKESDVLCINHTLLAFMALYAQMIHPGRPKPENMLLIVDEAHELLPQIKSAINRNFSLFQLKQLIAQLTGGKKGQIQFDFDSAVLRLTSELKEEGIEVRPEHTNLVALLDDLAKVMFATAEELRQDYEVTLRSGFFLDDKEKQDAKMAFSSLLANAMQLRTFLTTFPSDQMLELSKDTSKRIKSSQLRISFYPFTYEQELQHIYSFSSTPPIMTSATLFNVSKTQLLGKYGLNPNSIIVRQIQAEFDYLTTIKGFCFPNIADVTNPAIIVFWLKQCLPLTHGNALVLFTNTSVMKEVFYLINYWGQSMGYNMLIQGQEGDSIQKLIQQVKDKHNSVLFGVASLWTGNDIKGANLSNLIITKLPFRAQDNFANAFSRFLEEQGLNPFYDWVLPEMISTFRQGLGRLKRDETDKGLVFIFDPRFVTARYKPHLISRLPLISWTPVESPNDLPKPEELESWLGVRKPTGPIINPLVASSTDFDLATTDPVNPSSFSPPNVPVLLPPPVAPDATNPYDDDSPF
jgi:ATP-dependent DNA helicase DinG